MRRPAHVKPPAYLTPTKPVPAPKPGGPREEEGTPADPTRYGDWTRKGIAIDF